MCFVLNDELVGGGLVVYEFGWCELYCDCVEYEYCCEYVYVG